MRPLFLSVLALFAVSMAHADALAGKYRLRSASRSSTNQLTLRVNGRFLLEEGRRVVHGDYRVEDGRLVLRTEDGDRLRAELNDGTITLDGDAYERVTPLSDARRFPTDGASGRLRREEPGRVEETRREPVEEAPRTSGFGAPITKSEPTPAPAVVEPVPKVEVAPALPALLAEDCHGVWTVRRGDREEKTWRMDLKKDGKFRFGMKGMTSEGTWTVEGREIVLRYTKVDGEDLEEGASGVKRIPVARDGSAFQIDTYRYERATK